MEGDVSNMILKHDEGFWLLQAAWRLSKHVNSCCLWCDVMMVKDSSKTLSAGVAVEENDGMLIVHWAGLHFYRRRPLLTSELLSVNA